MNKVVIIGAGNVGMSYAYALINQKTSVNELYLIDLDEKRVEGEVMDLNHGASFAPSKMVIHKGKYSDCKDANIVCICAGANQKPGETRIDLLNKNARIFKNIVKSVIDSGFNGIFLVASNPVDIASYMIYKFSGFEKGRIVGTGTTLDTARLRYLVSEKLDVSIKNVHAYVLGEHGDSEMVSWSNAYLGSNKLENYMDKETLEEISFKVKNSAYEIINKKGATYYAIGMGLVRITNAILNDEKTILTVSSFNNEHKIYIGMPSIVGKNGVEKTMQLTLNQEENIKFNNSANIIKGEIEKLNM